METHPVSRHRDDAPTTLADWVNRRPSSTSADGPDPPIPSRPRVVSFLRISRNSSAWHVLLLTVVIVVVLAVPVADAVPRYATSPAFPSGHNLNNTVVAISHPCHGESCRWL